MDEIIDKMKRLVYDYNKKVSKYGVYLKPYHIVYKKGKKYIYIGRYWYRLEKKDGKLKWIYLGKVKPYDYLPDPPEIPEQTFIVSRNN